jgi:FtsZ-binding cell division protein ZapB
MQLLQFEKLRQQIKKVSDQLIRLKLENRQLKHDNELLRKKLKDRPQSQHNKIKRLEQENSVLRNRQQVATNRLSQMLDRVRDLAGGVES